MSRTGASVVGKPARRLARPGSLVPAAAIMVAVVVALALAACAAAGGASTAEPGTAQDTPTPAGPLALRSFDAVPGVPSSGPSTATAVRIFPTGPMETALVIRVVDGDTIVIDRGRGEEKVRYIGVDTPETVHPSRPVEWMGVEASSANRTLVEGRQIVLESDVSETDRYGRLLRYVWLRDGEAWTFVNLELLRRGVAQVVTYPPDVKYVEPYLEAQRQAREDGLGLWSGQETEPSASSAPDATASPATDCDPAYPTVCIPPPPPDLDCADIADRRFAVRSPDPHRFDGNHDGVGCER